MSLRDPPARVIFVSRVVLAPNSYITTAEREIAESCTADVGRHPSSAFSEL